MDMYRNIHHVDFLQSWEPGELLFELLFGL